VYKYLRLKEEGFTHTEIVELYRELKRIRDDN